MICSNFFKDFHKQDPFWTTGLPEGSIFVVCPCVRPPVFKYLKDCSLFFSEILHEVGDQ